VGSALDAAKSEATGTVHLTSATLGAHTLLPTACVSGERHLFLGVDFLGDQGITTRLIVDPTGAASLRLFAADRPLDQGVLFHRQDCSRFQLSLDRTGWRIDEVYDLRVSFDFDCRTAAGDAAKGALVAAHCH
jgi:hypothetical protein